MKETEITVQVFNDYNEIDKILKNKGFSLTRTFTMNDWYFSPLKNISTLSYQEIIKNSFLVRQIIRNNNEELKLCYKDKSFDKVGNVISEEKTEAKLSSLHETIKIFNQVKLNNYCIVKNNSFVYQKDNISFSIQIIENLGIFIEFEEYEEISKLSPQEKFDKLKENLLTLGLNLGKDFSCKKVQMLLNK